MYICNTLVRSSALSSFCSSSDGVSSWKTILSLILSMACFNSTHECLSSTQL